MRGPQHSGAVPSGVPSDGRIVASSPPKDPLLMAVLSGCCIVGLGQIILGQAIKGIVVLLASMTIGVLTGGVAAFVIWPAVAIDAYCIAKKLKDGKTVGQWEFF